MASRTSTPLVHPELEEVSFTDAMEALRDPQRLSVIATLARYPDLACGAFSLSVSKAAASRHLKILRRAGLILQRDAGTRRLNRLRRDEFEARFPGLLELALAEGDKVLHLTKVGQPRDCPTPPVRAAISSATRMPPGGATTWTAWPRGSAHPPPAPRCPLPP
jgi:DNA-binding transcriptional ArsR family regulator